MSDKRWGRLFHKCGGEDGFGRFPFDVAVLFYNRQRWTPIAKPAGGCMERILHFDYNNYRAFLIQAFERNGTDDKVVVAVAHYSHAIYGLEDFQGQLHHMQ